MLSENKYYSLYFNLDERDSKVLHKKKKSTEIYFSMQIVDYTLLKSFKI